MSAGLAALAAMRTARQARRETTPEESALVARSGETGLRGRKVLAEVGPFILPSGALALAERGDVWLEIVSALRATL